MLFGPDGEQIPGQGQPNWSPLQYLQNLGNFFNGNQQALAWIQQNWSGLLNPSQAPQLIAYFIAWQTYRIVNWTLRTLRFLIQELPLLITVGLNLMIPVLGGVAGMAGGLSGLAGLAAPVSSGAVAAPIPQPAVLGLQPPVLPTVAEMAPMVPTSPAAPAAPVVSTPTTMAAPAAPPAAPPIPPAPLTGAEGFGYMVGWAGLSQEASLQARSKTAKPATVAAASTAATAGPDREEARARRRRHSAIDRGHRYEYLEADDDLHLPPADRYEASDRGAGPLGFGGTATKTNAQAAGLTTLTDDGFGSGPRAPMLPDTWEQEGAENGE